jgi:hypothetical protein
MSGNSVFPRVLVIPAGRSMVLRRPQKFKRAGLQYTLDSQEHSFYDYLQVAEKRFIESGSDNCLTKGDFSDIMCKQQATSNKQQATSAFFTLIY